MGFLSLLLGISLVSLWVCPGIVIASYGDLLGWHIYTWIPMTGYIGGSIGLGVLFNKTRKHGRAEAFDDRLPEALMDQARERWIRQHQGGD